MMINQIIEQYKEAGYTEERIGKPLACSELAMHMRIAEKIPSLVLVNTKRNYAMIVVDGRVTSGIYHEFDDRASIS